MGIWIRSQNRKTLVNADEVYARMKNKNEYEICTGKGNSLGIYSSEEKAIKVLDILQELAIESDFFEFRIYENNLYSPFFYENSFLKRRKNVCLMPKDDEVNMEE